MLGRILLVCAMMGVLACGEQQTSVPSLASQPAVAAPKAAEQAKRQMPNRFEAKKDAYFYNPVGKRDPFKSYVPDVVKGAEVVRSPLERFDLKDLILTGIIWGISDPRGLLRAPDGYSYVVRANTRVGNKRGRVAQITRSKVFVEEESRDPSGKIVIQESIFEMRKSEASEKGLDLEYSED